MPPPCSLLRPFCRIRTCVRTDPRHPGLRFRRDCAMHRFDPPKGLCNPWHIATFRAISPVSPLVFADSRVTSMPLGRHVDRITRCACLVCMPFCGPARSLADSHSLAPQPLRKSAPHRRSVRRSGKAPKMNSWSANAGKPRNANAAPRHPHNGQHTLRRRGDDCRRARRRDYRVAGGGGWRHDHRRKAGRDDYVYRRQKQLSERDGEDDERCLRQWPRSSIRRRSRRSWRS